MKNAFRALAVAGLCLAGVAAWAQNQSDSPAAAAAPAARRIVPNDALTIRVVGEQDCQVVNKRVGEDGSITFPYIGRVEVKGLTSSEVEQIIRTKLMDGWFKQPQVVANVDSFTLQTVSVIGKVNRPGPIEIPPDRQLDVIEAIGRAGDLHPLAKRSRIELRRTGEAPRFFSYDHLKSINDESKKIYVKPNDIVFVPERIL